MNEWPREIQTFPLNIVFHGWIVSVKLTSTGLQIQTHTGLQLVGSRPVTACLP